MSGKSKTQTVEKLEPRISLCSTNPVSFLNELQAAILAGYRIDPSADLTMFMNIYTATLILAA